MGQRRVMGRLRHGAWVLVTLGLTLLLGTVVYTLANYRMVTVMGDSMRPAYPPGDQLLAERIDAGEIRRGDVLLIDAPEHYRGEPMLRRVIGMGGDHVVGEGSQVTVNGKPVDEPYVRHREESVMARPYDVKVPDGRLFLLGDYRVNSNDSRFHLSDRSGSIAASGVQARVPADSAAPGVLATLASLGIVLVLAGVGGYVLGWRGRRSLSSWTSSPAA